MEFLDRFTKRMEFVAIADTITGRINKDTEIENCFMPEEINSILLSVLVFIMETDLKEEQHCTLDVIADFLKEILPAYETNDYNSRESRRDFAKYLVKDILQNDGKMRIYHAMDYKTGMKEFSIQLVTDFIIDNNRIAYKLTKQGYDFLFRTKEVDDELGFQIETMRLDMLIRKKNYKKALSQSRLLLAMLRTKREELTQLEEQMRRDVSVVSGQMYNETINDAYAMLNDEYKTMEEIERTTSAAETYLVQENKNLTKPDEKNADALREVTQILSNVRRVIENQRELIKRCKKLGDFFLQQLQESITLHEIQRFDFEEEIIKPMENFIFRNYNDIKTLRTGLLAPLMRPDLRQMLNLSLMYAPQAKIKEPIEGSAADDETEDSGIKMERVKKRNNAHVTLIRVFLEFAQKRPQGFLFNEFWDCNKKEIPAERLVFLCMLKLYEIREIDFEKWQAENEDVIEPLGEFDLNYCLHEFFKQTEKFNVRRILIDKTNEIFLCDVDGYIKMNDLFFTVVNND